MSPVIHIGSTSVPTAFSKDLWNCFWAPAGLPQLIMDKFVQALQKVLLQPNIQVQLEKMGAADNFIGPKEFADLIDAECRFYMELAKQKGK
jgi:tripartite-type tricarboxylate transporter receptor subunit TctC